MPDKRTAAEEVEEVKVKDVYEGKLKAGKYDGRANWRLPMESTRAILKQESMMAMASWSLNI